MIKALALGPFFISDRMKKEIVINNIVITNPQKVIFKNPVVTKLDLVNYYDKVSARMLPYIKNRLISVIRMPDGYGGEKFFKKHLENTNKGIGLINIKSDNTKEDYYYFKKC